MQKNSIYRPDIDGLRAIAVMSVIFYHAKMGFPGGFIGVDIFFVISGYLITSIISNAIENQKFSFLEFWERRVRRILPVLIAVTAATAIIGFTILFPKDFKDFSKSILWLCFGATNVFFWLNYNNYFDASMDEIPLLHTWSLSVEEQFYLFLPLFLFALGKTMLYKHRRLILLAITLVSLTYSSLTIGQKSSFYLLPSRAWELSIGGFLSYLGPIRNRNSAAAASWCGLLAILFPLFLYSADTPFPGYNALTPVMGAFLIIWSGSGQNPIHPFSVQRILSLKPFTFIGLLSYSLYLWHYPIIAFLSYQADWQSNIGIKVFILAATFALSLGSYWLIEQPVRKKVMLRSRAALFGAAAAGLACLLGAGLLAKQGAIKNGHIEQMIAAKKLGKYVYPLERAQEVLGHFNVEANSNWQNEFPQMVQSFGNTNGTNGVFLFGDSHASAMFPAVLSQVDTNANACFVVSFHSLFEHKAGPSPASVAFLEHVCGYLHSEGAKAKVKHVVFVCRWENSFEKPHATEAVSNALAGIMRTGYDLATSKQVPPISTPPRKYASMKMRDTLPGVVSSDLSFAFRTRKPGLEKFYVRLASAFPKMRMLDPAPLLLDEKTGRTIFCDNNDVYYYDDDHLSLYGARRLSALFAYLK